MSELRDAAIFEKDTHIYIFASEKHSIYNVVWSWFPPPPYRAFFSYMIYNITRGYELLYANLVQPLQPGRVGPDKGI